MPRTQSIGEFLADAYVVQNENLSRARQALEIRLSKANMHWLADIAQEFAHLAEQHSFAKLRDFHTVLQELYRSESQRLPAPSQQSNYKQQLDMFLNHVSHCVQHALRRISKRENEGDIKATLLRLDGSNLFLRRFLSIASERNIWAGHSAFDKILLAFLQEEQDTLEYFLPEATNLVEALEDSLRHFGSDDQDKGVNRFFRVLHTFKGSSYMVNLTEVGDICHLLEDALSLVREGNTPSQELMPIFQQGVQVLRDIINFLLGKDESASQHLGILLISLRPLVREKVQSRKLLMKLEHLNRSNNLARVRLPSLANEEFTDDNDVASETISSMRVNTENLDTLMGLSSELILSRRQYQQQQNKIVQLEQTLKTTQAHIKAFYQQQKEPELKNIYQQLQQSRQQNHSLLQDLQKDNRYITTLSYRMREEISQTRMVPMSQLFLHLRRLVEQLAAEHDAQAPNQRKNYRLETLGETITMDGGMLEELIAPMRHLINNALIHGIETLHERAANGKLPQGVVRLEATKHDNHIRIDIADDGRGLDFNEIQAKVLEQGLKTVEEIAVMTEPEVLELILLPGFSTAQRVGKHAGRGVGLDAVVTYVNQLKGRISISSTLGKGTRFSLEIPASITSNKVLSIQVGHKHFSLPAERVVNLRRIPKALRKSNKMMEKILLENHVVIYYDLKQLLGIPPTASSQESTTLPVVMMQDGQETVLLGVDNFGKLEPAIIYPLPPLLQNIEHLMGVSLMRDGRVLPLLNSEGVQELHTRNMLPHYAKRALSDSILLASPSQQRTKLSHVREHILIAEDSKTVREVVAQWLRREGFRVTAVADGQQAFEYLLQNRKHRSGKNAVDLLLTDIEMPYMDGYELIEALNTQLEPNKNIPIIVMSSRVRAEHQSLAMDLGASAYLTKPVQASNLMEHIHMLLASD